MALRLEISNLEKVFSGPEPEDIVQVFDRIDCIVEKGQFFTFVGPSGCGKTTLLRMIAGLEEITSGNILLNGEQLNGCNDKVGLVFQEYALFPWRKLVANIEIGLEIGIKKGQLGNVGTESRLKLDPVVLIQQTVRNAIHPVRRNVT